MPSILHSGALKDWNSNVTHLPSSDTSVGSKLPILISVQTSDRSVCWLWLSAEKIIFFYVHTHVQILGSGCFAGSFVASFFLCFSFKIRVKMGRLRWIMDRLEVMEIAQPWHNVLLSERSLHGLLHGLLDWVWVNRDHSLFHSSIKV